MALSQPQNASFSPFSLRAETGLCKNRHVTHQLHKLTHEVCVHKRKEHDLQINFRYDVKQISGVKGGAKSKLSRGTLVKLYCIYSL